jgi:DNA-binding NarL/FixJ family response regulator
VPIVDDDPIRRGEPLRLDIAAPPPVVRVVLAENDSPGPLHYLIESEGFQVVGCASDDADLARVLGQVQPDVIVLDADIIATSALVAREKAPSSELIVVWPDGVQLPPAAERVHPRLVYQDLGPAIRRAADDRRTRHPAAIEPADDDVEAPDEAPASADVAVAQRTSTRVLVGMAAVIGVIVLTMGAS